MAELHKAVEQRPSVLAQLSPDARCLACGYSIVHLAETRCPECGRAFDPADPLSFNHAGRWRRVWAQWLGDQRAWKKPEQLIPLIGWLVVFVGVFAAEFAIMHEAWTMDVHTIFWACPPLTLAWWVRRYLRRWVLGLATDRYGQSERFFHTGYGLLCILLFALSFHVGQTCPHGFRYGFGPVGWGYSKIGSPCNSPGIRYWNISERWYVWYGAVKW